MSQMPSLESTPEQLSFTAEALLRYFQMYSAFMELRRRLWYFSLLAVIILAPIFYSGKAPYVVYAFAYCFFPLVALATFAFISNDCFGMELKINRKINELHTVRIFLSQKHSMPDSLVKYYNATLSCVDDNIIHKPLLWKQATYFQYMAVGDTQEAAKYALTKKEWWLKYFKSERFIVTV